MTIKLSITWSIVLFFSCFSIFAQSRIPKGADDYLQVMNHPNHGGRDLVNVVFFEVPDTITSILYFAIRDPEGNGVAPDQGTGSLTTTYTLIGGANALSDSRSRQDEYSAQDILDGYHKLGTTLSEYIYDNDFTAVQGEDPTGDYDWVYFPGVSPGQGEHIGNKYYFKIVTECESAGAAIVYKNAYQLDISLNNTGNPTGLSSVRAFSYSWMLCFENRIPPPDHVWEIYPFVPYGATGDIRYYNHDMDNGEDAYAYDISGNGPWNVTESGGSVGAMTAITIGTEVDGTWKLHVIEDGNGGNFNTTEVWFENSDSLEIYRAYAEFFVNTSTADHIALSYEDGVAISGGSDEEQVTLQVVDVNGNPLLYPLLIYVQVSGSAQINSVNGSAYGPQNTAYITTDSTGMGTITIIDNSVETITVTIWTNGAADQGNDGNEANLPGTNDTVDVDFVTDILPSMSSAANLIFTEGTAASLKDISITDSAAANIIADNATGDVRIRIPAGLNAVFETGATVTPTVTGSGTVNGTVQYESGNTVVRIDVTGDFAVTDTLEISGLEFTGTNTVSTGNLEASFDGGATYDVTDDKFIRILSPNPIYIWDGSDNTDWSDGLNWAGGLEPQNDTDNVLIPSVSGFMPALTADETVADLTIESGASLDIGAFDFTITGTFSNNGTLELEGGQSLFYTNDTDSGLIKYTGAAPGLGGGSTYYNLEFDGSGTWNAGSPLTINGSVTVNGGNILSMGTNSLTVALDADGAGTLNGGSNTVDIGENFLINSYTATSSTTTIEGNWNVPNFTHNDGEVEFDGPDTSVVSGNTAFYDFSCVTAGKAIQFTAGDTQTVTNLFTMQGAPGNLIVLRSTVDDSYWMLNAMNSDVSYVDVMDSNADGGNQVNTLFSTDSGHNLNWSFVPTIGDINRSETVDVDNNGKIDRIVVYVNSALGLNDDSDSDAFEDFEVEVTGYEVKDDGINTGTTPGDEEFYIELEEGPDLDTDATPVWRITSNPNLVDTTSSQLVHSEDEIPLDRAPPVIAYTLAVADKDEVFICFSEPVQTPGGGAVTETDFTGYDGTASISGRTRITSDGEGTREVLLTLSANVSADEVVNGTFIHTSNLIDAAGLALVSTGHRVSDLGLGLAGNGIIQPIWARDETGQSTVSAGIGYISLFDNSEWLRDQDITLQAHIHNRIPGAGLKVKLFYDVNVPGDYKQRTLWLPQFNSKHYNGIVPYFNPDTKPINGTEVNTQLGSQLRTFTIREEKSDIEDGDIVEFVFRIPSSPASLYCTRIGNPDADNWYRTLSPWAFTIHDILKQKSDVTILNNVINPAQGEKVYLHYILSRAGTVTITIFDLKGDIVKVLYKGRKGNGDYTVSWDGRNRGGRIVSRGVYFIKLIAPGISEIRKVLVVR